MSLLIAPTAHHQDSNGGPSAPWSKLNVEGLLAAWATLCLLWASWIEENNFTGQKNAPSRNSFVIWVGFLTTFHFEFSVHSGKSLSKEGNQVEWTWIFNCVCFVEMLSCMSSQFIFSVHVYHGCSEAQKQAQGHLFRKWLSWDSNAYLSDSYLSVFCLKEGIFKIT